MRKLMFVAYVAAIGYVLLNPRVSVPTDSVGWGADVAGELGLPDWFLEPGRWEFLCNALVFTPIPVLGVLAWPAVRWRAWAALCLAGSISVELIQAIALPERSATVIDVVANTTGAVVACVAGALVTRRRRTR